MQNCEKHPSAKKEKFCKTCLVSVCPECTVASHKDHNVLPLPEILDEVRSAKDRIMVGRIAGISARKGLLRDLDIMLGQVSDRQLRLQEEAKLAELELPKTLMKMEQTVEMQKTEIARRIKDFELCISTSRETLINDLQTVSDQAELALQGTDAEIGGFLHRCVDTDPEGGEMADFRARFREVTTLTATYENFSPYDQLKELSAIYKGSDGGVTFDRIVKLCSDTSALTYYNCPSDTSLSSTGSTRSLQSPQRLTHDPEVTLAAIGKRLEAILAKHSHSLPADRSLEGLVQAIDRVCSLSGSSTAKARAQIKPKAAAVTAEKKTSSGSTRLIAPKSKPKPRPDPAPHPSVATVKATRLKTPRGTEKEPVGFPRPVRSPTNRRSAASPSRHPVVLYLRASSHQCA